MTFEQRQHEAHLEHLASDHEAHAQPAQMPGATTAIASPEHCHVADGRKLAFERQHPHGFAADETSTDAEEQVRIVGNNSMGPRASGRVGAGSSSGYHRR